MRKQIGMLLLWIGMGAVACTTSEVSTEPVDVAVGESRLPYSVIGTWRGVIPCIDCPGINYNLSLNENNTFEETMVYQERYTDPLTRTGTWQISNGILHLSNNDTTHTQFDLSIGGELHMLNQFGKRFNSKLTDNYRLRRDTGLAEENTKLWNEKRRLGVDFVGTGNEPGWALEIDLEKGMFFKTLPNESIALNTPIPEPEKKGATVIYRGKAEGGELIVELIEQNCEDSMSGEISTYTVRITAKGIEFNGCGMYLSEKNKEK